MKYFIACLLILIISSCSKIPTPSILSPSENKDIRNVSFGEKPISYQNILKLYLVKNLQNYKSAKVEFINKPSKLSINHLGNNYTGYRLCLSINEKKGDYYIGPKNHFFLINNNQVNLHLFDSGLLTIPFEYCVSRNISNEIFIDDIPDNVEEISVESMDKIEFESKNDIRFEKLKTELDNLKKENEELKRSDAKKIESSGKTTETISKTEIPEMIYKNKDDIYILCTFDNQDTTYIFSDSKAIFKLMNKLDVIPYSVSFNNAYIVATRDNIVLTINRVSGKATLENKLLENGMCELTNKTKF